MKRNVEAFAERPAYRPTIKGRLLWLVLALLWTAFIWGNSLQPAEMSGAASGAVVQVVEPVLTAAGIPQEEHSFVVRKGAHLTEFALLGIFWAAFFGQKRRLGCFAAALALCMVTAAVDEGIQHFVPGRSSQLRDIGIDTLGAAAGIAPAIVIFLVREKRASRKERMREGMELEETEA